MKTYNITRRNFLQGCSYAIAAMAGARLTNIAFGQSTSSDTMAVVFLRGGWDALNVIPPIDGDDRGFYEAARPSIQIPKSSLLRLNDQFGMHPALAPLHDLYQNKNLAVVHAVGLNYDTRSHFDAQEFIELGTPGAKGAASGWISRYMQNVGAVGLMPAIATSEFPTSLLNYAPTVTMNTPSDFSQWDGGKLSKQQDALRQLYAGNDLLHEVGLRTLDALSEIKPLVNQEYQPANGAKYNDDDFGRQLQTVAQMIKLNAGLRVATVDFGGWDTHQYETDGAGGYLGNILGSLGSGLSNFFLDLSSGYSDHLSVVVISEFGRRLVQNESHGTDHGHGSVMLALGGNVNGGQVYGAWPGLKNDQLYDHADLAVTTDYRQVLSELLQGRLGVSDLGTVFPGFSASKPLGVFRSA